MSPGFAESGLHVARRPALHRCTSCLHECAWTSRPFPTYLNQQQKVLCRLARGLRQLQRLYWVFLYTQAQVGS